jgi:hypothetical protein
MEDSQYDGTDVLPENMSGCKSMRASFFSSTLSMFSTQICRFTPYCTGYFLGSNIKPVRKQIRKCNFERFSIYVNNVALDPIKLENL